MMEGDVDAFLEEVRSSEKLLHELQERLRGVVAGNDQVEADVAGLKREQHSLAEESLRSEQELATVSSQTLLQDVRLKKVLEYNMQAKGDVDAAEAELSEVRGQLQGEINKLCSEASTHLVKFGLNGVYHAEAKQRKLDELAKTKHETEQLSSRIQDLERHETILKQELQNLADTEQDIENKRRSLSQPLQGRAHVHELQQTLYRLVQEQRDGLHLQQLKADISDAEDETTCLRSAASAMSAELQRLEQLLWFNNMEKMKQRMRATAKCAGQYHCSTAGVFNTSGNSSTSASEAAGRGPPKPTRPWPGRMAAPTVIKPAFDQVPVQAGVDLNSSTDRLDAAYEELDLPQDWSASDAENPTESSAGPSEGDAASVPATIPEPPAAPAAPAASPAAGGADPSTAELAQRRWRARQALMMAHRQPAAQPQHHTHPQPAASPAPAAPPLASVRPQLRPQARQPTEQSPAPGRREWGRAAGPGRLSYRGPQPARRATDFRTGLQKLRENMAAPVPQKRVRFSTEPEQQEGIDWDDETEDFL